MIKKEIFDKNTICHALVTSTTDFEIMIPVKGVIEDIYLEEDIPVYSIRIIKFYDTINFLKSFFIGRSFLMNYQGKPKPIKLPKTINNLNEIENWLGNISKYRFCVESNLVFRRKSEMMEFFNKIQEYLILQKLRFIKVTVHRSPYSGELKLYSNEEFKKRIKTAFGDKFKTEEDANLFVERI